MCTEMVQFYIDGRMSSFADFMIDLSGGITGLLLVSGLKKGGQACLIALIGGSGIQLQSKIQYQLAGSDPGKYLV